MSTWGDWFALQDHLTPRLAAISTCPNMDALWKNVSRPRPGDADLQGSLWRIQSEFLSRVLTVGAALRRYELDPHAKPLTIHVAGASHNETMGARLSDYDELNQMFPGHQGIEVVMVGPEVVDGPLVRPPLTAFGPRQRVYISAYKGLYHQFWEELVETGAAARPDLVVGFHPGTSPPAPLTTSCSVSVTQCGNYQNIGVRPAPAVGGGVGSWEPVWLLTSVGPQRLYTVSAL